MLERYDLTAPDRKQIDTYVIEGDLLNALQGENYSKYIDDPIFVSSPYKWYDIYDPSKASVALDTAQYGSILLVEGVSATKNGCFFITTLKLFLKPLETEGKKMFIKELLKGVMKVLLVVLLLVTLFVFLIIISIVGDIVVHRRDRYLFEPEIKYGEFDFTVVYEVQGQQYTVSDTLVCEFDAVFQRDRLCSAGYSVRFSEYIKSLGEDNNKLCLAVVEEDSVTVSVYLNMYCGHLFLGANSLEMVELLADQGPAIEIDYKSRYSAYRMHYDLNDTDEMQELYESYHIKIVSFEHDSPIINQYPIGENAHIVVE